MTSALAGFGFGLSLIVAIGAQNAFVLRQGLLKSYVGTVVAICTLSDVALIAAGIAGMGGLLQAAPTLRTVLLWLGIVFLLGYAALALRRAIRPGHLDPEAQGRTSSRTAVATTCLALTWLNPHVYLDTVLLLGSVAQAHEDRIAFGVGAGLGSLVWFTGLGYGARLLRPVFSRDLAWRILDVVIAVIMLVIAAGLAGEL